MKFYSISPIGSTSPGLFETFPKTFNERGHFFTTNVGEADIVLFDMHAGYLPYNWGELRYVLNHKIPVIVFDAHDYHGDSTKYWYFKSEDNGLNANDWYVFIKEAMSVCKIIYFMRKIQTDNDFHDWIYPYELCQYPDHDFPLTTKEELNSRPYDACFIGAESPRRKQFIEALQKNGRLKLDVQFTTERIPHEDWLNRHRQAKFFIEADGGGLGSERPYQLMTIAPMLKQGNNQLMQKEFINTYDCVKIDSGDSYAFSVLHLVLNNPDELYKLYLNGNDTMKKYFSWEARANYILDTIESKL